MKLLLSILAGLMALAVHAQSFEEFIQKGDDYYDQEQFEKSAHAYQQAFEREEGSASQYYNAACSWALTGDTIKSLEYLHHAADKGWKNLKHLKRDEDLRVLHDTGGWDEVLAKVQANKDEYEKDFNKPLQERLEDIYVRDQTLRQLLSDVEEKFGRDSEEMAYFWGLISEQDSLNELEVIRIIEEHGWVGMSVIGGRANTALWLVVQHAPLKTQEKYLPLLRESVKKEESSGSHLALLEDRILMRNGKPQKYGSQITTDPESGEQIVYEIEDPEYVNQRRREVGLGPIEDYVKHWGIEWTIEQKENN